MSAPEKKPTRKGPSLVSAATQARSAAQPQASASSSSTNGNASAYRPPPPTRPGAYVPSAPATVASGSTSGRSTPTLQDGNPGTPGLWGPLGPPLASAGAAPAPRLKFRPKQPSVRPVKTEAMEVKPDIAAAATSTSQSAPSRSGDRGRGRGRGAGPGRGGRPQVHTHQSVGIGIFGQARNPVKGTQGGSSGAAPPRPVFDDVADVYSDDEENGVSGTNIVDISAVSGLGESAPTSLIRAGRETGRGKAEEDEKKRLRKEKTARRAQAARQRERGKERESHERPTPRVPVVKQEPGAGRHDPAVKPEPVSPEKRSMQLNNEGVPPPIGLRTDDVVMDEDLSQDRDEQGRRIHANGDGDPEELGVEVNEEMMVDLSESESEEEEESMEGDFVPTDGYDDPSSKLYIFQFPHLFPNFLPQGPIDLTAVDQKPDLKPTDAELRAMNAQNAKNRRKAPPPPEGRIGSLVVMKSGKVKVVLGDDIVMNLTPGVPCTFLQHLVHLDVPKKSVNVLGEVNKQFVLTPDIDRLLKELWLNDGETPAEKAAKRVVVKKEEPLEDGLMRLDDD